MKCHREKLFKMLEAHNKVTEINNAREKFEDTKDDVHDIDSRNDFDLHEHIEILNADQFCVFKMVSDHLCHQR